MPHLEVIVIYGDTKKLQLFVEFEGSPHWTKKSVLLYMAIFGCMYICIRVSSSLTLISKWLHTCRIWLHVYSKMEPGLYIAQE